jgi:two-component system nitrate/nitrite response regulator NarL
MLATALSPATLSVLLRYQGEAAASEADVGGEHKNSNEAAVVSSPRALRFSARERCVLRGLTEGNSNKTIARRYKISDATVKVHVKAILRKIRVKNPTQAAILATAQTLIGGPSNEDPRCQNP